MWISVNEQLPEPVNDGAWTYTQSVLVVEPNWDRHVAVLWRKDGVPQNWETDANLSNDCTAGCNCRIDLSDVTHWQPLPAPPISERSAGE